MADQYHNIEKLRMEFLLLGVKDNFRFIQNVKAVYYARILEIMNEVMNEFCGEEEHISFDRIELDLGTIRFPEFNANFVDEIKTALRNQLRNAVKKIKAKKTLHVDDKQIFDTEEISGELISTTESEFSAIKYFLENGILPWHTVPEFNLNETVSKMISIEPEKTKLFFKEMISSETAVQRMIKQLSHDNIISIIDLLEADFPIKYTVFINELLEVIRRIDGQKFLPHNIEEFVYAEYLKQLSEEKMGEISQHELILKTFKYISELSFVIPVDLFEIVINKSIEMKEKHFSFKSDLINILIAERKNLSSKIATIDTIKAEEIEKAGKLKEQATEREESKKTISPKDKVTSELKRQRDKIESAVEKKSDVEENIVPDKTQQKDYERIYVENAGLVLLNPYLKTFFENRGFITNDEFVDTASQIKAVHLLQYIISGSDENPEHLLALNKILCGLDTEYPIDRKSEIDEDDIIESEQLVQSVIKNWEALKDISINGFKESFLIRKGIIEIEEDGFLLRVERKAYDILLDKLPWTISMIQLPWMKKILRVEW